MIQFYPIIQLKVKDLTSSVIVILLKNLTQNVLSSDKCELNIYIPDCKCDDGCHVGNKVRN